MGIARHVRGTYWESLRRLVIMVRGRQCQRCLRHPPTGESLILHHTNKDGTDDRPDNLELLCERCHDKAHRWIEQ